MLTCVITLLVWHVAHVVFLVVQTLYAPPFICSFSVTTVDSFTSNVTLTTQLILSVSYRFGFEHSRFTEVPFEIIGIGFARGENGL